MLKVSGKMTSRGLTYPSQQLVIGSSPKAFNLILQPIQGRQSLMQLNFVRIGIKGNHNKKTFFLFFMIPFILCFCHYFKRSRLSVSFMSSAFFLSLCGHVLPMETLTHFNTLCTKPFPFPKCVNHTYGIEYMAFFFLFLTLLYFRTL